MRDATTIIRERQLAIRREMDRRGISLKQVSFDSGIPYPTLQSYFPAEGSRDPAVMPTSGLFCLVGALPDDLLSLFLPDGRVIVSVPEGVDHDRVAPALRDYLRAKDEAHHPDSEAGRDIGPGEDKALRTCLSIVGSVAA